jgi:uncharacterized repeat protein (TIGR01451 family)
VSRLTALCHIANVKRTALGLVVATIVSAPYPAAAAATPAGTLISNTARASYSLPSGGSSSIDSNTVTIIVDELLNVSVASSDGGDVGAAPGSSGRVLTYTVTNTGNGSEAFRLSAINGTGDDFDPTAIAVYLDANGNKSYDPGIDLAYIAGSNDPVLAADGSATVFLVSSIAAGQSDTQRASLDLRSVALTGSGTPGTSFAGAGTGGGAAVVGATGAAAQATGTYRVAAATVTFAKTALVSDPFGGASAVPGSIITYKLIATVSGSGSLDNLAVTDQIPAGTTYRAGSLTLENGALSDSADGDAGEAGAAGITARLGSVAAGQARTVTFKVTVTN